MIFPEDFAKKMKISRIKISAFKKIGPTHGVIMKRFWKCKS